MSSNSINQVKIKKLDGTYDARNLSVNYDNVDGLSDVVPVPTVYDSDKFLKGDGTWGKVSKGVSYGTSPTAADVASKVVTSAEGDFELEEGASINVKFTYGNTAGTPTLNIDTLGNKLIKAYGTEVPSLWWNAGDIVNFVYDGTNFIMRPTEGQINEIQEALNEKQAEINDIHNVYNSKNILPYNPTLNIYPYNGYGVTIERSEDGIFTINGTATSGRLLFLSSRSKGWIKNNFVGMKLSIQSTNADVFYASVKYYETSSSESPVKSVAIKNNDQDYIIEDYPYILFSFGFSQTTFNNDTLAIMLRSSNTISREYIPIVKTNKQLEETKQDITDNTLTTTAKTVVGAINEVNTEVKSKADFVDKKLATVHPSSKPSTDLVTNTWNTKIWSGSTNFYGNNIWTDGDNIYYSSNATQRVLDKSTSTWTAKTWNGLSSFSGSYTWTDGENIYYSGGTDATQYVLDKSTSTWTAKTWSGLTNVNGIDIWTDGDNIYYSSNATQRVLDKSTSTWTAKTWNGLSSFSGQYIWTDGDNIYYSQDRNQYILNKSTSTWTAKTWSGLTNFNGNNIWTDGDNIYRSAGDNTAQYVLDKSTSTWSAKTWNGLSNFSGQYVWTDGENTYCSASSTQYVLDKLDKPFELIDTRDAIAKINSDLTASDNTKFEFTKSGNSYGYKNSSGTFVPFKTVQASKTVTAGTSAQTVTPDSGYDGVASVTVNPTPSQTKSTSPSTLAQTITPDSGKLLSSVTVNAISPLIGWEQATITDGGLDGEKAYVWVPYGYHVNSYNGTNPIWINQDVLQNTHKHSGTYTASSRSSALDMGLMHNYRYVNTNSVPNSNSGTYSVTSNGTNDMGASNSYRYVSVAVNQTPSYSSYSPTGKLEYHNGGTSSTNSGGCYVELGTPSVSKSGSTIKVTIPETLWPYGGYGKYTAPNNIVYRSIVINLTI